MKFLSLFSGIDAASVAWKPLGWKAAAFAENEPFPSAVLKHHYPDVPNLGDVTKADIDAIGYVDLVVGGSPCQSFSVAGKRLGLDDARGNLALVYGQIVYRKRPRWFVFENVPGLLSSDSGWDFGTLLAAFAGYPPGSVFEPPAGGWGNTGYVKQSAKDGYGLAWRVLDAQYVRVDGFGRAVPQRRRRVFVVGYLGDWRRAAAVLFERQSLSGHPAPRRQPGQGAAPTLAARTKGGGGLGTDFDCDGGLIANAYASTLTRGAESAGKGGYAGRRQEDDVNLVASVVPPTAYVPLNDLEGVSHALNGKGTASGYMDASVETYVAHALRADGFDASEDGTGRGTPLVPVQGVALRGREGGATAELTGDVMTSLRTGGGGGDKPHVLLPTSYAIQAGALRENPASGPDGVGIQADHAYTVEARSEVQAIAFDETQITSQQNRSNPQPGDPCHPLASGARAPAIAFDARQSDVIQYGEKTGPLDTDGSTMGIMQGWRVRRLTPTECLRLQGFPDDYLDVLYRGKPAADGPKYKACGNSMAVNCMRWIGTRIKMVEALKVTSLEAAE